MLRSLARVAVFVAGALALAPAATAQIATYSWMPPAKVQEAMEKENAPAIFYFEIPNDAASTSIGWNFNQPPVVDALTKLRFAACRIAVTDQKSTRPWGAYQKIADEFGVTPTTTLVIASYDRKVLALITSMVKRDEFIGFLKQKAGENAARLKAAEEMNTELTQVEKWIEDKKIVDANRRMTVLQKKEKQVPAKSFERFKEVDGKLETACKARLTEGKALLDGGKASDSKPIFEEVVNGGSRFECAKEAKECLKKAKAAKS